MKATKIAAAVAVSTLALGLGAPAAHARNDFWNGFEDELGRIAVHTLFGAVVFGVPVYREPLRVAPVAVWVEPAPPPVVVYAPPPLVVHRVIEHHHHVSVVREVHHRHHRYADTRHRIEDRDHQRRHKRRHRRGHRERRWADYGD